MIRPDVDAAAADNALRVMHRFAQRLRKARGGAQMRYNPFGLIRRRRLEVFEVDVTVPSPLPATADSSTGPSTSGGGSTHTTKLLYERNEYTHAASGVRVVLQQRCEAAAPVASDIHAAAADCVDNTGAFHWAAEDILAHLLLRDVAPAVASCPATATPRRYLELGAGVGLAGLMLVAALIHPGKHGVDAPNVAEGGSRQKMTFLGPSPPVVVVLSDGNRAVVDALRANASLAPNCDDEGFAAAVAPALHLPWQHHATLLSDADLAAFDAIIGADCLFFEDFHPALADLVLRYLALRRVLHHPVPSAQPLDAPAAAVVENAAAAPLKTSDPVAGVAEVGRPSTVTFVAPSRGGSLDRFAARLREAAAAQEMQVSISVTDRYDPAVYAVHQRELADAATSGYEVDRHFPLLMTIW
jgi:hypothetical protein